VWLVVARRQSAAGTRNISERRRHAAGRREAAPTRESTVEISPSAGAAQPPTRSLCGGPDECRPWHVHSFQGKTLHRAYDRRVKS